MRDLLEFLSKASAAVRKEWKLYRWAAAFKRGHRVPMEGLWHLILRKVLRRGLRRGTSVSQVAKTLHVYHQPKD